MVFSREHVSHEANGSGITELLGCSWYGLTMNGGIVWAAIDVERWDILAVWITTARS